MKVQSAPQRQKGPVATVVSAWTTALVLFAFLLVFFQILKASDLADLVGLGAPFEPFPSRIPQLTLQDAYDFYEDVPFGKVDRLEKWTSRIRLRYEGNCDAADLVALKAIVARFNSVKGFPGIQFVTSGENVLISYIEPSQYATYRTKYRTDTTDESFCSHWSTNGVITKAGIVIVDRGSQSYVDETVLHEFTHLVGFVNHSPERDSILNTVGPVPSLSPVDLLALRMYYDARVKPGMTLTQVKKAFVKAKVSEFIVAGPPLSPDDAWPELAVPLAVAAAGLLLVFLASIRSFGVALSLVKACASASAILLVAWLFTAYFPQVMDLLAPVLAGF